MQKMTLVFVIDGQQILLAMKKQGFGKGRYNGLGGKVKTGENIEQAAKREAREECGIKITKMHKRGVLVFYPDKFLDGVEVHIYLAGKFTGAPKETKEMKPKWFKLTKIPYDKMWDGDKYWMPFFLAGKKFKGEFIFDRDDRTVSCELQTAENF